MSGQAKSVSPSVMSETFGLSTGETEKKRKVVTPPFSWAQLLPLLFPSDQLWCEHASDALRFGQDTPSDTLHPSDTTTTTTTLHSS